MRRTTLTAALGMALVLAGCSSDGSGDGSTTDSTTSASTDASASSAATEAGAETTGAAAAMEDPVCAGFFQTGAVTLADRATKDRDLLASGDTLDPASWGEISLLNQRITQLGAQAEGDQADLLERINAPFVEATDAVLSDEDQSPTDEEITVPEIDVADSGAAQDELETACAG
ncbi:hypothetical protein [Ornithinimicrobium avium]|uniref:Uncharacterized protein n=1 Tax=Ornithinimicrobium avium TaxID=2283195 RepID=A0A345NMR9_9MICO|nr:hypothetical protein [Ornithinimicrobium avium]AXH96327.1 hypothetical protein DV701_09540 [Ornithinimicrobium avium]